MFKLFASKTSTIPSDNGISGPTTVKPISFDLAKLSNPETSSLLIDKLTAHSLVPPLPGATKTSLTLLLLF